MEEFEEKLSPVFKWGGGKRQLLTEILPKIPPHTRYYEPFIGGAAVLLGLKPEYAVINDFNEELVNTYKVIRDNPEELIQLLEQHRENNSVDYFYEIRAWDRNPESYALLSNIQKAARTLYLNRTCFNGLYRVNKSGKFNVPAGKYKNPLICDVENLANISKNLQNVIMRSRDYHDVEEFADKNTLVYFDPPYRPLNVTSGFTSYTEEQFNDKDQIELAELYKKLAGKGVKLLLSNSDPHNVNYEDDFFDALYAGFDIQRITAVRMINSKAEKRGNVTELLIKNY